MAGEQLVSGEEYQKMRNTSNTKNTKGARRIELSSATLRIAVAVLILCGLSFAGGIAYQKHRVKTAPSSSAGPLGSGFGGRAGGARRGGSIGQVTAVSTSSITITNQRTNASQTYAITSSTTITDNSQTVAASDIKTGDTVLIATSTSDTATATRILVNPSFGGGFGGSDQNQGAANPDPSTNSTTE